MPLLSRGGWLPEGNFDVCWNSGQEHAPRLAHAVYHQTLDEIWGVARRLGVREFVGRISRQPIRDDHVPLHEIGRIPVCDVIQFPWRFWHTRGDVPAACSADSLAKVGWVIQTWLFEHGAEIPR